MTLTVKSSMLLLIGEKIDIHAIVEIEFGCEIVCRVEEKRETNSAIFGYQRSLLSVTSQSMRKIYSFPLVSKNFLS